MLVKNNERKKMEIKVGSHVFNYPKRRRDLKAWQSDEEVKKKIEDNLSSLSFIKRGLCKIGFHNNTYDHEIYAWVLEDKVWHCNRCGHCHRVEHYWHSD